MNKLLLLLFVMYSCNVKPKKNHDNFFLEDSIKLMSYSKTMDSVCQNYKEYQNYNLNSVNQFCVFTKINQIQKKSNIVINNNPLLCNTDNLSPDNIKSIISDYKLIINDSNSFQISSYKFGVKKSQDLSYSIFRISNSNNLSYEKKIDILKKFWFDCEEWNSYKSIMVFNNFIIVFRYGNLNYEEDKVTKKIINEYMLKLKKLEKIKNL